MLMGIPYDLKIKVLMNMNKNMRIIGGFLTLLMCSLCIVSCEKSTENNVPDVSAKIFKPEFFEAFAEIEQESSMTRTETSPYQDVAPAGYSTKWVIGDEIKTVYEQDGNAVYVDPWEIEPKGPNFGNKIFDVDPDKPAVGMFKLWFPDEVVPSVGNKTLVNTRTSYYYSTYGLKVKRGERHPSGYDIVSIDISPIPFKQYSADQLLKKGNPVPELKIPLRSKRTRVDNYRGKNSFVFQFVGSMQIIEFENASTEDVEEATLGFNNSNDRAWFYPVGTTYDPITNDITPGAGEYYQGGTIKSVSAGQKTYLLNWMVPRRTDNNLRFKEDPVNNFFTREPTQLEFKQSLPVKAVATADLSNSKQIMPGKAYWYRLKWDGQILILLDVKVLPFTELPTYIVDLN